VKTKKAHDDIFENHLIPYDWHTNILLSWYILKYSYKKLSIKKEAN
jgi:hypothetical protein